MKTTPIRLHRLQPWDRSAKVSWLLTELGLPFETRTLARKDTESEEYLRLNPMGRVPVLELGDRVIYESSAILTYLADLHPEKGLAPAIDHPDRSEYLQWMAFASATLDTYQARVMIIEDIPAGELQRNKESVLQSDVHDAMTGLDRALTRGPFLLGKQFTAADIGISYHLYWLRMWPELDSQIAPFKRVTDYLERMKQHPAAVKAEVFSYQG